MRVLYVEQDFGTLPLAELLAGPVPGLVLESAATAGEAAARLAKTDPPCDVAVVLVSDAAEHGLELVRGIRRSAPEIAVVAVLASDSPSAVLAALQAGADDYVARRRTPPGWLPAAVERAIRRRRAQSMLPTRPRRVRYGGGSGAGAEPVRLHLARSTPHLRLLAADGEAGGAQEPADVMLLDLRGAAAETLERLRDAPDPPVVVLVDPGDEELGVQALRLGACGFVVCNPGWLHQLPAALEGAVARTELRRLAGRLLVAQEEERRRIARELHDDVGQRVTALGMGVARLAEVPGPAAALQAARLRAQVESLAERVRGLSHRMHPALLEHAGLVPALESVCEEFGRDEGIRTEFRAGRMEGPVPPDVALAAYRVAQEALRNVARHSAAAGVRVTLTRGTDALDLLVADSGVGFDPGALRHGLGLVSMAERVHLLGGEFRVVSAPGAGTQVHARLPLSPAKGETPDSVGS